MKQKIKNWFREKIGITKLENELENELDELNRNRIKSDSRIDKLEELSLMGVDLGAHEQSDTYIILATKLKGGVVKIIPMRHSGPREVVELFEGLEARYRVRNKILDLPRGMRDFRY